MGIVASLGTGRTDYSENVEYATAPTLRSHQRRVVNSLDCSAWSPFYSYNYPYASANAILIPPTPLLDSSQWDINTHYVQRVVASAGANALITLFLYKFPSYDELMAGYSPTDQDIFGSTTGYGKATLAFTKGIVYDATFGINLAFNLQLDNPYPASPRGNYLETCDYFYIDCYMIEEETVYGL